MHQSLYEFMSGSHTEKPSLSQSVLCDRGPALPGKLAYANGAALLSPHDRQYICYEKTYASKPTDGTGPITGYSSYI